MRRKQARGCERAGPEGRCPPPSVFHPPAAACLSKRTVQELTGALFYNFDTNSLLPSKRPPPQPWPKGKSILPSLLPIQKFRGCAHCPRLPTPRPQGNARREAWRRGPNALHALPHSCPGNGRRPRSSRVPSAAGRSRQNTRPHLRADRQSPASSFHRLSPLPISSAPPGTHPTPPPPHLVRSRRL